MSATIKALSLGMIISTASILPGFAAETVTASLTPEVTQVIKEVSADNEISKSESRKIIKEYLKSNDDLKHLKAGQSVKFQDKWRVDVTSRNNIRVLTTYVDDKTGEITLKQ
mgnify:CR=1 FL=1